MILFIRGIPELTLLAELAHFVSPALKSRFLLPSGKIVNMNILALHDKRTNQYEFHGLVEIDSERAGRRAIKRLNGKRLNGKRVVVREYMQRSWQNDRRRNHAEQFDGIGNGKRLGDRRRGKELDIIKDASGMFSSNKNESRKLF